MSSSEVVNTKRGLGRGLGSLLGGIEAPQEKPATKTPAPASVVPATSTSAVSTAAPARASTAETVPENMRIWNISIDKIKANPSQPRRSFDPQKLKELADSLKEKGLLQPITVRKMPDGKFQIVAGERRWRAAQQAGLHEIPAILKQVDDKETLELALIENIQRHDLNPIDEAEAYEQLVKKFNLTQEQIAQKVGKDRATVANSLRLLGLSPDVREMVSSGQLSTGHAKVILALSDAAKQKELAKKILNLNLSVRATEKMIKTMVNTSTNSAESMQDKVTDRLILNLTQELQKTLGTKVLIDYAKGKGKIQIQFYSDDELTGLVDKIRSAWKN